MATIRTAIQVQDGFSGALRSMSNALQLTLNNFESLQRTSGNAVDTASIEAARRELARTEQSFNNIEREILDTANAQDGLNNSIGRSNGSANGLLRTFVGIAAAIGSVVGIRGILALSDDLVSVNARLDFVNDGLQTTAELQDLIRQSAQSTFTPYNDVAGLVATLANNAGDAFANTKEIVYFSELLNKSFANNATGPQQAAAATLQLTQALGSGVLRGEELNSILEAAPSIVQNIEKSLGITRAELRKMATDGQITADVVKNSLFQAAQDIESQYASTAITFSQLFVGARDRIVEAFGGVLQRLNELGNSDKFQSVISALVGSTQVLGQVALGALNVLASFAGFVVDNFAIIGPIIGTVVAALTALTTAIIIARAATLISTAITFAHNVALAAQTGATFAATTAQYGLNAALLANPIGLVILAVIALVGLFYLVIGAINRFAGTSISATGLVIAAFAAFYTFAINIFKTIGNVFLSVVEFIINAGSNLEFALKSVFVGIANAGIELALSLIGSFDSAATNLANFFVSAANIAIGGINKLIDAINTIPGVNLGNVSEFESRTSITGDLRGIQGRLNNLVADVPTNFTKLGRFELNSVPDAAVSGYNKGSGLSDRISGGFDNLLNAQSLASQLGDSISNATNASPVGKAAKDTAKSTKAVADSTGILVDDLKYLRDLSEREAINRYTTGEIVIEMNNNNNIGSDLDLDGIVDGLASRLADAVEIVAEGSEF